MLKMLVVPFFSGHGVFSNMVFSILCSLFAYCRGFCAFSHHFIDAGDNDDDDDDDGATIHRPCCQLSSTDDRRQLSHWASTLVYNSMGVMQRVARVRLRETASAETCRWLLYMALLYIRCVMLKHRW